MNLAAKRPPEPAELEAAEQEGFSRVELYLNRDHLDNFDQSLQACRETEMDVVSLHTPHVCRTETDYLKNAFRLAEELSCLVVFHSSDIFINDAVKIAEEFDYHDVAFEQDPGFSVQGIENLILDRGKELVLDVAHLYIGSEHYLDDLDYLLDRCRHIHLCDSTSTVDGVPFGSGEMDMEQTIGMIEQSGFDGCVVVEVMPEHQAKAKKMVEQVIDG